MTKPFRTPLPLDERDVADLKGRLAILARLLREGFRRELAARRPEIAARRDDAGDEGWEAVSKASVPDDAAAALRAAASGRWTSLAARTLASARVKLAVRGARDLGRGVGVDVGTLDANGALQASMRGRETRIVLLDRLRASGNRDAIRLADRLERDVRESFARALAEDHEDLAEAERAALRIFDDLEGWQAERLARDQLAKATKEGRQAFAETFADVFDREWIAVAGEIGGDGRNRASHLAMHGKIVAVGEPWIVDYSLDNPRYPSAVAETTPGDSAWGIQCRCDFDLVEREDRDEG